jgi:hypothetical protein
MPFAAAPADFYLSRPDILAFGGYQEVRYASGQPAGFTVTRRALDLLRFGQTEYRLRSPLEGVFKPATAGGEDGDFSVEGFQGFILGQGPTPNEAYEDWLKQFHVAFQRLYAMRPFEMDASEQRLWDMIESRIDVEQYRNSQSLVVKQEGKVVRARPYPEVIEWEDGTRERVALQRMPAEFAGYRAGQPFEAVIHRDPVSYKIRKVDYVKRLPTRRGRTEEESKRLWESVPTSGSLPDTDWD